MTEQQFYINTLCLGASRPLMSYWPSHRHQLSRLCEPELRKPRTRLEYRVPAAGLVCSGTHRTQEVLSHRAHSLACQVGT